MVKDNCYNCEYKESGINYTNCKRKCSYKYKMQRYRSNKEIQQIVENFYKDIDLYFRAWVKENYQTKEQIEKNQELCETLFDFVEFVQRKIIPYSPKMDFMNHELM